MDSLTDVGEKNGKIKNKEEVEVVEEKEKYIYIIHIVIKAVTSLMPNSSNFA